MARGKKIQWTLLYTFLIIYAAMTIFPFLWALSASFKPLREITSGSMSLWSSNFSFDTYIELFSDETLPFFRWIMNSTFLCLVITAANLLFNTMAGYALARMKFLGRDLFANIVIACISVPAQVLLIPNYLLIVKMGLNDSFLAIILLSAINTGYIIMSRQFFINFPKEVEEAAQIDGLGTFGTFFRISLPMTRPLLGTQALFIFMGTWNEFLKSKLYLSSPEKFTLTIGLQFLSQGKGDSVPWDRIMASSVISIIPIIILFIFLNKYFMHSDRSGISK